jgi:peptide-methionine (S)-S-oxide reductase
MSILKQISTFATYLPLLLMPLTSISKTLDETNTAIFAGGCFWCLQADFDKLHGVIKTTVGYTGGDLANPSYEQVSNGGTGHFESLEVVYDPTVITYAKLLDYFWQHIDPINPHGQFCDLGEQYRAAIFYRNEEQKKLAIASQEKLLASGKFKQLNVEILAAKPFYIAEEYHQKYYQKNPVRYRLYRYSCGRDQRVQEVWGK